MAATAVPAPGAIGGDSAVLVGDYDDDDDDDDSGLQANYRRLLLANDSRQQQTTPPRESPLVAYMRSAFNGAITGISATFTIIAASAGARLSVADLASMSLANLLGDGFALGIADGVSSWVAQRHGAAQLDRVRWRVRHERMAVVEEVVRHYDRRQHTGAANGADDDVIDAQLLGMYAALDDAALEAMVATYTVTACAVSDVLRPSTQQQQTTDGQQHARQRRAPIIGLVTTLSFVLCGSMAVLALYAGNVVGDAFGVLMVPGTGTDADAPLSSNLGFYTSGGVTFVLLFALGALNSRHVHMTRLRSGLLILACGMPTALLVFGLSKFIEWFVVTQVDRRRR